MKSALCGPHKREVLQCGPLNGESYASLSYRMHHPETVSSSVFRLEDGDSKDVRNVINAVCIYVVSSPRKRIRTRVLHLQDGD
jgi:hypothetical protein